MRTGVVDEPVGTPRLGIDLGTANIVVSVVDDLDRPVAGGWVAAFALFGPGARLLHANARFTAALDRRDGLSLESLAIAVRATEAPATPVAAPAAADFELPDDVKKLLGG